jgi:hypothetical protein
VGIELRITVNLGFDRAKHIEDTCFISVSRAVELLDDLADDFGNSNKTFLTDALAGVLGLFV